MRRFLSKIGSRGRSDSEDVFEELLIRHLDHVYGFALRLTQDPATAEDLVQEASLRAFGSFDGLKDRRRFKNWIFRILRNIFINQIAQQTHRGTVLSLQEIEEGELPGEGDEVLLAGVLAGELLQALDALPAEFRVTLWLSDVEGFSHREIAEILNCPPGTVGSRLYRARTWLREKLSPRRRQAFRGKQS